MTLRDQMRKIYMVIKYLKVIFSAIIASTLSGCAIESSLLEKASAGTRIMALEANLYYQEYGETATIDAGKEAVKRLLREPESAEFSEVSLKDTEGGKLVCGYVNAKNGFGGFVGATPFAASQSSAEIYQERDNPILNRVHNHAVFFGCLSSNP